MLAKWLGKYGTLSTSTSLSDIMAFTRFKLWLPFRSSSKKIEKA